MKKENISAAQIVPRKYGTMRILCGGQALTMRSKSLDCKVLEIDPRSETSYHYHALSESFFQVMTGSADMIVNETVLHLEKGDGVLVDPGEYHRLRNKADELCIVLEVMTPPYRKDDTYYAEAEKP